MARSTSIGMTAAQRMVAKVMIGHLTSAINLYSLFVASDGTYTPSEHEEFARAFDNIRAERERLETYCRNTRTIKRRAA